MPQFIDSNLLADADGGGAGQGCAPLRGSNPFSFMKYLGKNGQIIAFHIHLWSWRPHLGGNPASATGSLPVF